MGTHYEFVCYYLEYTSAMFPNDIGMMLVKTASDFMFHTRRRHVIWSPVKLREMTQNTALPRPVRVSFLNL